MDSVQAKKAEICSLWGLPMSQIETKLSQLKIIIANQPEQSLLDYLLRADLNIERAIDLHFAVSTPTPPPQNNDQNNNHNHNISHNDNVEFIFEDSVTPQRESSEDIEVLNSNNLRESTSSTLSDSNPDDTNPFEFLLFPGIPDADTALSTNNNIKNRNQPNRKRKRIVSDHEMSESQPPMLKKRKLNVFNSNNCESDSDHNDTHNTNSNNRNNRDKEQRIKEKKQEATAILVSILSKNAQLTINRLSNEFKKRTSFVETHHLLGSFNNFVRNNHRFRIIDNGTHLFSVCLASDDVDDGEDNSNSNSNNRQNEGKQSECDDAPMDIDEDDEPEAKHDPNWTRKVFGTIRFEVSGTPARIDCSSMYRFSVATKQGRVSVDKVAPNRLERDETKLRELYDQCLEETPYEESKAGTGIRCNINKVCLDGDDEEYEEALRKETEKVKTEFGHCVQGTWFEEWIVERAADRLSLGGALTRKRYSIEFEISLNRSRIQAHLVLLRPKRKTSYHIEQAHTIALLGRSKALMDEILETKKLLQEYSAKKHIYTMVSLLDFACRYSYDIEDTNDNYSHELNVRLHPYQLQSLRWMIDEENDEIGFYRHLFKKGRFEDNTSFHYSAIFKELIIDDALPVAHGGFLCEEMGLGKTIISLALLHCNTPHDLSEYSNAIDLKLTHSRTERKYRTSLDPATETIIRTPYDVTFKYYKSKATLIIAPTSLVGQWEKECDERCNKKLNCKRYYGPSRSRNIRNYIDQDIIFTTYGIMAKERGDDHIKHILHQIEWHRVILDESHYIKNGNCGAAKSINRVRAKNRWCLTGTPFGRQIFDIHNQLQFIGLQSQHLNALSLRNISKRNTFNGKNSPFGHTDCIPLMRIMQTLVMRHTKAQSFNDKDIVKMPEKEEDVIFVEFTTKQREYYNKLYSTAKERYDYYKTINNIGRGSIAILSSLHPARQACSGYIYSKDNIEQQLSNAQARTFHIRNMVQSSSRLNLSRQELYEIAQDEAYNDRDGECPICYECPFDEPLQTPCRHIFCGECIRAILLHKPECPMCRKHTTLRQLKKPKSDEKEETKEDKEVKDNTNNNNVGNDKEEKEDEDGNDDEIRFDSKLKVLIAELKKIKRERPKEKSLIFTSFSKSLNWMCSELKKNGFEYRTLTGSMTMNKRKKQLEQFSNNDSVNVFVLSVRSGAVGITLTSANHVFMLEPPFNAALHRQAINRVYRLGQKKKVYIHTLIMKDSIEERIWNVNKDKQNPNNNSSENANMNKHLAGNICADKNAKLDQHEISKLFEGDDD